MEKCGLQKLFIWVSILSCPSNQQLRFLTLLVGAMLLSPTCMESMLTLGNCCLVPMILNSVLSSFSLIQAGEQFSIEWQKSWLISIPLLSLVYDRESQYYLRMSIVKSLHINSELFIKAFIAKLIRFQAFESHCTRLSLELLEFYHSFSAIRSLVHYIHCNSSNVNFTTLSWDCSR